MLVNISIAGVMSLVNILLFVCRLCMMSEESWRRTETHSEMIFSTYSGRAGVCVCVCVCMLLCNCPQ